MSNEQRLDPKDHRSIGNKLKYFIFDESTPGMPFWLPDGARLRKRLETLLYDAHIRRGYEPVISPAMMDAELWKISGHYQNYRENMFPSEVEKREYLLKPMNCPAHVIMYKSDVRSYKDLPLRYFEFGEVHRNENSGSLHGLFRVREFTQDDLHSFVTPEQVKDEILEHLSFIKDMLKLFNFEYELELSTRPTNSIGSDEVWEISENAIRTALAESGEKFEINEGDGAFYGPKIDIKVKDNHGREWQLGTIQVDFNLPERFGIHYVDQHQDFKTPVMIHRAVMGSFERFLGILLEHFGGLLPVFLSPYQIAMVPISSESEEQSAYLKEIEDLLNIAAKSAGQKINVRYYNDSNTLNKRIKNAEEDKNPIVLIVGDKEVTDGSVNIRHKVQQQRSQLSLDEFLSLVQKEIDIEL